MGYDWKSSTVFITGASSGIGAALAMDLSERGARIVLSARSAKQLEDVRQRCHHPERHVVVPLDLADAESLPAVVDRTLERVGRVHVLVNNGGVSQRSLALETVLDVDRRLMEVNYLGTVALTKALLPHMIERGGGRVVVVSSLVGKFGTPFRSGYSASKHALHGYFDSLRAELHDHGIHVTMVCPGFVHTRVSENALTGDGSPLRRMDRKTRGGISAEACARGIVRAVDRDRAEVHVGGIETLAIELARFAPAVFRALIRRVAVR